MVLQPGSFFESDTTGATETISLKPLPPATSTNVSIASAVYGAPPQVVPVAADRKSVSIKVLDGINALVITLVSPSPNDETVQLVQGSTQLALVTVRQHSGVSAILIKGTPGGQ
jgi:hypothetical protein